MQNDKENLKDTHSESMGKTPHSVGLKSLFQFLHGCLSKSLSPPHLLVAVSLLDWSPESNKIFGVYVLECQSFYTVSLLVDD